jgi:hypothetical protein
MGASEGSLGKCESVFLVGLRSPYLEEASATSVS